MVSSVYTLVRLSLKREFVRKGRLEHQGLSSTDAESESVKKREKRKRERKKFCLCQVEREMRMTLYLNSYSQLKVSHMMNCQKKRRERERKILAWNEGQEE